MTTFTIKTRATQSTLNNPSPTTTMFEFHNGGENFGGKLYDMKFWNMDEAKADFIKWCGY